MINVMIVDDSETEIQMIKHILSFSKDITVVGTAKNGKEALPMIQTLKPDIITMDILMPVMDGLEAIKYIMSHFPTPIVVISSTAHNKELKMSFKALELGALSVLEKPTNIQSPRFELQKRKMIDTIRAMSEISVITRRYPDIPSPSKTKLSSFPIKSNHYNIIAIGSSVGGPQVLRSILSSLPSDFPIPIVIVQHMTPGFIEGFVQWLDENCSINIKVANDNDEIQKETVYFAPDGYHLEIHRKNSVLKAKLVKAEPISGFCPSATALISSVSKSCHENAVGILLTGMGHDGAQGLLELKQAKGHTIIQDKESAVVFGMAGTALSMGAVDKILHKDKIASYLIQIADLNNINIK